MDSAQLLALIGALRGRTVAVIGDVVADEFVYGRVARVSREAPVLILEYDSTEIVPGGAGNAANNVAALGGAGRAGRGRRPRRAGAAAAARAAPARRSRAGSSAPPGADAGQDAHPGRRHPFRQAAGRAHRSRRRPTGSTIGARAAFERAGGRRVRAAPTRCWCPTTARAW